MDPAIDPAPAGRALEALRYAYPATVFIAYLIASVVSLVKLHAIKATKEKLPEATRRRVSLGFVATIALSYLIQVGVLIARALTTGAVIGPDSVVVGWLSAVLVFGIEFASLEGAEHPVWYIHAIIWVLSLGFEAAIVVLSAFGQARLTLSLFDGINVALAALRICILVGLLGTLTAYYYGGSKENATDEEQQGLLSGEGENANGESSSYGATKDNDKSKKKKVHEMPWQRRQREARERMQQRLESNGNLFTYLQSFSIFWPYIWPANNRKLQFRLALVGCCMLVGNALNLLVPRQFGIIMDDLTGPLGGRIWTDIAVFIGLRFLASESGVTLFKSWLMIPVRIFSMQTLKIASYSHIMHLSADFHDSTSYSEMWNATYGGQRMTAMLERMLFTTVPMFIDMVLAFVYLSTILGPYEALISIASGVMFVYLAARMVARRDGAVRELEELTTQEWHIKSNGLDGWQTVNSFNQVEHECERYKNAVREQADADRKVQFGWQTSSAMQSLALMAGLAASATLAVIRIREGQATPGQFATLLSYWAQLSSPLRYFVELGKDTKEDLVYCERLLHIMSQKPSIANNGTTKLLKFGKGEVEFDNVTFSYDKQKQIIKNLSFTAEGGKTVALVGATGSGKSTILKLLNRFYDVCEGSVKVDGQDLRDVDLHSLRDRIGVVPQNVALFADSVMNNVRYAKLTATDEEVYAACKAACMHDKILTFTDGYDSFVGDRGIKLSGGEQQRVAIARAILKDPDIVLLDEATSAVDTDTEQKIHSSFQTLCKGRTTFVVAHRLSTVKNADRIIVIGDGEILEDGTHDQLLARDGKYANLWKKQGFVRPETEAEKAMGIHDDVHPDPECDLEEEHVSSSSSSTIHDSADEATSKGKQAAAPATPDGDAKAPAAED